MKLINVYSFEIKEFVGEGAPIYCILSHRWSNDEIDFKTYSKNWRKYGANFSQWQVDHGNLGLEKVKRFANIVAKTKMEWIWIDTCTTTPSPDLFPLASFAR